MHYKGETHEITVPLKSSGGGVTAEDIARAAQSFHSAHESLHTFSNPDEPVYFMNLKLEAIIQTSKPPVRKLESAGHDASAARRSERSVYFDDAGGFVKTPIYDGASIRCGNAVHGPCVIEEPATTIVVYPDQMAHLTELDNYEITIR
jgi:N-methylhydantoinase A